MFELDENNRLIDHVITYMYSLLKTNISLLLSTNQKDCHIFINVKNIFIKCIKNKYLKMNNPSKTMMKTISDCLSIIIICGVYYHWPSCIKDLINESTKENLKFCYIVLRALGSIDYILNFNRGNLVGEDYADSVIILQRDKQIIEGKLIENKDIVIKYLLNIYNNINNFDNGQSRQLMIEQLFDTTKCWTNFELNLFKSINISKMIYNIMNSYNMENPEKFSDMIYGTIFTSNNCKLYEGINVDKNSTPAQLSEQLFKRIDLEEKKGIDELLLFLLPKLLDLKNKNNFKDEYTKKLLISYTKIFSAIIENYIYLFFNFKDEKCKIFFVLFSYFLKFKNRRISSLFFEGMDEMRNFINNFYKFAGLNETQIVEFINYLMDIFYGVMENCSFPKLDQNDMTLLDKEILIHNNNLNSMPLSLNQNKGEEIDEFNYFEDIDINQYREYASSVFSSIFFIIFVNFGDSGMSKFINKILACLPINEVKEEKNVKDKLFAIKTDVVLFVVSSILDIFEVVEEIPYSENIIHGVINEFLGSKLIYQNQRIFIDFIVLINKFRQNLISQPDNFKNVAKFLLFVSKNSNNSKIVHSCYIVLLNIFNEIKEDMNIEQSFINEIFNLYQDIYSKYIYPNMNPLENVVDIILIMVGISKNRIPDNIKDPKKNIYYDKKLQNIIQQLALPITNIIKMNLENVENNNQNMKNKVRFEIVKGYYLLQKIISTLKEFSSALTNDFVKEHLNNTLNLTQKIFQLFQDDEDVIEPLIDFYTKNAEEIGGIGGSCINIFQQLNQILINYYLSSPNHYKVLETLKNMYLHFLLSKDTMDKSYMQNNKYILDQYYLITSQFINNISKENITEHIIKEKIKSISDFHCYFFHKLIIQSSSKEELIKYYNLIQNLINVFIKCITLFQNFENTEEPVDELTLTSISKSFNDFFINTSLQRELFNQPNNNNSCIFADIILSLWQTIYFKKFNCLSRRRLIDLYINMLQYDTNLFSVTFERCISESNKFPPIFIKAIIEYMQLFKNEKDNNVEMLELIIESAPGNKNINNMAFNRLFSKVVKKKGLKKIGK